MKLRTLAIFAISFIAPAAYAQTALQPGSIVGTFQGGDYFGGSSVIYTVPMDRNARVTDVIVTNYHTATCNGAMTFGSAILYFRAAPDASLVLPLNSGFGVTSGNTVALSATNCPAFTLYAQVRGFNFTIP
jgi:hypothetical protein